jgi:hypothetical protein
VYVQNALVWQLRTHKQQNNVHREGRRVRVNAARSVRMRVRILTTAIKLKFILCVLYSAQRGVLLPV